MFPIIPLIFGLVIVGLVLWVIQQIPMDPVIAKIIRVVIIVAVCLWLLSILLNFFPTSMFYPTRR